MSRKLAALPWLNDSIWEWLTTDYGSDGESILSEDADSYDTDDEGSHSKHYASSVYELMLLALCKDAQVLHLDGRELIGGSAKRHNEWEQVIYSYMDDFKFQKITMEVWRGSSSHERIQLENINQLLSLSSLHSLALAGVGDRHGFHHQTQLSPNRLQSLEIRKCDIEVEDFEQLIRACPLLRSLTLQWESRRDNYFREDWHDLGNLVRGLTCLETLVIDHVDDLEPSTEEELLEEEDLVDSDAVGSLSSLSSLKHLTISSVALFGEAGTYTINVLDDSTDGGQSSILEHLLPGSLKTLTILHHAYLFDESIGLLLHDCFVAKLDQLTLFNSQKDRWLSKDGVEHHIPIATHNLFAL
ncbi:Putative leucine-rich repeat domain superfamily [Septoria linicola]|uniref:Leucine-rich repeat domain superfamily n=1 Tax=Septoria linicola TaxID=215465 RepID=A0A9Q9EQA8_9PEZI|nr:putative leucine-rich repeat domain superfamily [Septoria linicola]USW57348.1 Putative leucine-rich repeat domain superfamily [Septoria linicola]